MREIKAPNFVPANGPQLFLAGSIEMGAAELWQERVVKALEDTDWTILNPRRDDWDSSWVQSKDFPQFREQVEWELNGIEGADTVLIYFAPNTKSPISLLELGLFAAGKKDSQELLVICPEGFWRKGNVDIVCERYNVRQFESLDEALSDLLQASQKKGYE